MVREAKDILQRFAILSILFKSAVYCDDLNWIIKTKTVIYGHNLTLSCQAQACLPNTVRKWIGGQRYDLLVFNHNSTNPSKYQMMYSNSSSSHFDLMIQSFKFSDANCEYTCVCGFLQSTRTLKLDDMVFIYPPDVNEDSSAYTDDLIYINISMKVYPKPTCMITYEDAHVEVNNSNLYSHMEEGFPLYTVQIQHNIALGHGDNWPYVNLICIVRHKNYTLFSKQKVFKDKSHVSKNVGLIIGLACGGALISCIILISILVKKHCLKNADNSYTQTPRSEIETCSS